MIIKPLNNEVLNLRGNLILNGGAVLNMFEYDDPPALSFDSTLSEVEDWLDTYPWLDEDVL